MFAVALEIWISEKFADDSPGGQAGSDKSAALLIARKSSLFASLPPSVGDLLDPSTIGLGVSSALPNARKIFAVSHRLQPKGSTEAPESTLLLRANRKPDESVAALLISHGYEIRVIGEVEYLP